MATQNPRRLELGSKLRLLRVPEEGRPIIKPADVEERLGWYPGKLNRVENGTRVLVQAEVEALADLYGVTGDDRATLILLAQDARRREAPSRLPDYAQTYVTHERAAAVINYFDGYLLPGLLQTEQYARALLTKSRAADVEARVAERIARRDTLTREDPPTFRVLLGEAALYQEVGGKEALIEQLQHLLDVGDLPNVSIRIVPYAAGAHRMLGVGFAHLSLTSPEITRVYIEGLTDATYIHEPDEVAVYEATFEDVWSTALDEARSATILRRCIGIE